MNFPETRPTLIQRIAVDGREEDWRQFMEDYWRPVCRFAAHWGRLNADDAEDVASTFFEILIRGNLLARWSSNPNAKVRTLLCGVIRNVLSNRNRLQHGRERLVHENRELFQHLASAVPGEGPAVNSEQVDAFYNAWVEELLQDAVEILQEEYLKSGRGDYFRVLYGRVCERMPTPEIATALSLKVTTAENCYKHARKRLGELLEQLLRDRVSRYSDASNSQAEFEAEWRELSDFLLRSGGLEECLRRSYATFDSAGIKDREQVAFTETLSRINLRPL